MKTTKSNLNKLKLLRTDDEVIYYNEKTKELELKNKLELKRNVIRKK